MIKVKRMRLTHKFCPHCKRECNIKTYKDHKRLYFSQEENTWYGATLEAEEDSEDLFSLSESNDDIDDGDEDESETYIECTTSNVPLGKYSYYLKHDINS